ncbi:MAG: hypothetical protein ACK4RV_10150 [Caulobacter sp.]
MSRNGPVFDSAGSALVYAGEAVTVQFVLQQPDGEGGYEAQDLDGRSFAFRVYGVRGDTPLTVRGVIEAGGVTVSLTGDQTADLLPGTRQSRDLGWEFLEVVDDGHEVHVGGVFQVVLAGAAEVAGVSPGSGGVSGTSYILRSDTSTVIITQTGAQGRSAKAAVISAGDLPSGATDEAFSRWLAQAGTAITANTTATRFKTYLADTSGGAFTLTLPADPDAGDWVRVQDGGDFSAGNLTIARNGETINGLAENLTVNTAGLRLTLIFNGTTWTL